MNWSQSQLEVFPITFIIIIIASVLIGYLLKNKPQNIKDLPFKIITVVLILAEIYKQIRAVNTGYNLWSIPLHYCSMFMVWFFMASFLKGKAKITGEALAFVTGIGFMGGFLLDPTSIIGSATNNLTFSLSNFGNLHTFFYHFLIVMFLTLQITLKTYKPTIKNIGILIPFVGWMIISTILANLLNVNFSNFLHNNVALIDNIRLSYGYLTYIASMYVVFIGLFVLILLTLTAVNMIKNKFKKST